MSCLPAVSSVRLHERHVIAAAVIPKYRQRLSINRASARYRRIINDWRPRDLLERYSFIVTPHGGGLAAFVFCERVSAVIEIRRSEQPNLCHWLLSQQTSLAYHDVIGPARGPTNDIEVDADKLQRTLEPALATSAAPVAPRLGWR